MKTVMISRVLGLALLSSLTFACANTNNGTKVETDATTTITEKSPELEKVGYSVGYMMGKGNREMLDDLNLDTFEMGFRQGYADKESALTEEQMQTVIMGYQQRKQAEMLEKSKAAAVTNKAAGTTFLTENAKKPGVVTTASGLQYKVLKPGTGKKVTASDMVKVNYEGKLLDGTVFDSSYKRKEPAMFAVQQVIPGFSEGLTLMQEGGEYELYIPAELAYGETGAPGIDSNSTLIFKVELLEVNPKMPEQAAAPVPAQ